MMALCIIISSFVSTGCAVNYQGMSFQNAQSGIREVYIRNAGTENWGKAIPITNNSIAHIDRLTFARRVDIKAIDHRGNIFGASNVDISRNGDKIGKTTMWDGDSPTRVFLSPFTWALAPLYIPIAISGYSKAKKQRDAVAVINE